MFNDCISDGEPFKRLNRGLNGHCSRDFRVNFIKKGSQTIKNWQMITLLLDIYFVASRNHTCCELLRG
jgi:hypothetical protein